MRLTLLEISWICWLNIQTSVNYITLIYMMPFWSPNQLPCYSYAYMPSPICNLGNFPSWLYNFSSFPNCKETQNFRTLDDQFQQNFPPQLIRSDANLVAGPLPDVPPFSSTLIHQIQNDEEIKKIKLIRKLQNRPKTYLTEKRIYLAARQKQTIESPRRLRSKKQRKQLRKSQKEVQKDCQSSQFEIMGQNGIEKIGNELKIPVSVATDLIQIEEMEGRTMGSGLPFTNEPNEITSQPRKMKTQKGSLFLDQI